MEIRIEHLEKKYDQENVLDDISFSISRGEILGILGISGAGKSTLLRCMNGLENYQKGSVWLDDQQLDKLSKKELQAMQSKMGMIFQGNSLMEQKTIFKNVALPLECQKYPKNDIKKRVLALLAEVGLKDKAEVKPRQLSGGQKQRVAIARALATEPEILLCDEATSALDPNTTNEILSLLNRLNKKLGLTIVVVTHQMEVVKKLCNRVVVLNKGKLLEADSVKKTFLYHSSSLKPIMGSTSQKNSDRLKTDLYRVKIFVSLDQLDILQIFKMEKVVIEKLLATATDQFRDEKITSLTVLLDQNNYDKIMKLCENYPFSYQLLEGQ